MIGTIFFYVIATYAVYVVLKNYGLLPKKSVKDWHIFITGAGNGIGQQMALRFVKLGAKVSLVDLNFESVKKLEGQIKQQNPTAQVVAIKCDVSSVDNVKQAAKLAQNSLGPVDMLINNAGIVSGKKLLENNEKLIEKTIAVNTTSHHYTVREFLPHMLKQNKGHIVTIASMAGISGTPGLVDYCASQFGAVGFDESLRLELRSLKSEVQTTCICPFYINTGMFDGVQTKFPLILPILEEGWTTDRIVNAILQNEPVTYLPWICTIAAVLKTLVPCSITDYLVDFLGISSSMDEFKGRNAKKTE